MTRVPRPRPSPLEWLAGAWLALGVVLALASALRWDALFPLGPLVWLGFIVAGALLFVVLLVTGLRTRRSWKGALPALAFLPLAGGLLAAAPWLMDVGNETIARWRFARNVERYDRIVAGLTADLPPDAHERGWARGQSEGTAWVVDPGPPVRVAFVLPGASFHDRVAIVHDPSDRVLTGGLAGDSSMARLFGLYLVGCSRMPRAHYFRCSFT